MGTWEWNVQTGETLFNERWAQIIGYTLEEISPVSIDTWIEFSHPDDLKMSETAIEKHFRGELEYYEYEGRMKHKDGHWVWILDRGKLVSRTEDGKPWIMMGTHQDITQRKNAELALQESEKHAQSASLAKSQFVSNMSHEIRTPLNGVIGFSSLLQNTVMTADQKEYLGYVQSSAKNLLALVNDILDISKIEAGKMELHPNPTLLEEVCKTAMDSVRHVAYTKSLSLSFNIDPSLTHSMIEIDGDRLRQILLNLLGNAVKFTQEGAVAFTVVMKKRFDPDGYGEILFSVQDTGPGIEEEDQKRLFEEFYQADTTHTRKHGGTGLGLAISQRFLQLMDSRLNLASQPGQGSTFSFLLKVKRLSKVPSILDTSSSEEAHWQSHEKEDWKTKPYTILITEDNVINQKLFRTLVKKHLPNASIYVAETGLEGVDQWKELKPDLVLMDLLMPEMDGIEATQTIRAQETYTHTPIIALTAAAESQDLERCVQAGMDGYLTKPLAVEALLVELEKWLGS